MELIINVVANENGTISVSGADEQLNNANEKQRKVLEAIKKACSECVNPTVEKEEKKEEEEKNMVRNIKVAYNTGYEDGYKDGYDNGYDDGSEDGYDNDDDDCDDDDCDDDCDDDETEDSEEYELTDEEMKFLEKDFPLEEVLRFQFGLMSEEEAIAFFEKFEKALKKLGKI